MLVSKWRVSLECDSPFRER